MCSDQIRQMGELAGHPDRAAPRSRGSMRRSRARARRSAEKHYRVLPLSRRGWVAGSDSFVGSLLAETGLFNAAGDLGFAFGGFASLEAIVKLKPDFLRRLATPAIAPRMTAAPSCCIRRWSASIRRKSASSFRSG